MIAFWSPRSLRFDNRFVFTNFCILRFVYFALHLNCSLQRLLLNWCKLTIRLANYLLTTIIPTCSRFRLKTFELTAKSAQPHRFPACVTFAWKPVIQFFVKRSWCRRFIIRNGVLPYELDLSAWSKGKNGHCAATERRNGRFLPEQIIWNCWF